MSLLLLLVVSWLGSASLQQIDPTADPAGVENPLYPLADSRNQFDPYENSPLDESDFYRPDEDDQNDGEAQSYGSFYKTDDTNHGFMSEDGSRTRRWIPNIIDTDKTRYIKVESDDNSPPKPNRFLSGVSERDNSKNKRNFSPWGGKRDTINPTRDAESYIWSWKRTPQTKESNMPKRVRFSPWGGKRSNNVIFMPSKASKIIYSSLAPGMWMQQVNANDLITNNKNSHPLNPSFKKKYQLLKFKRDEYEYLKKHRLPLYDFSSNTLNTVDVTPKKKGKRKVKFSAWGGKRSPPLIGPVWVPSTENSKNKLNTILLVSDDPNKERRLKL